MRLCSLEANMADPLSSEEEQATAEFLQRINFWRSQHNAAPLPWDTAVKFLMARKFDVNRAIDLYAQYAATRYKESIFNFHPTEDPLKSELLTGKFTVLPTRDYHGAAIALFTAKLHDPSKSTHQLTLKGVIYQLDQALENRQTQRNGLIFVYDMTDSAYSNFDYDLSRKILNLLKGGYPARMKRVLIVTAPLWFKVPFSVLRQFVREKLRERVHVLDTTELHNFIPLSALPTHLGGDLLIDHPSWLQRCWNASLAQDHAGPNDTPPSPSEYTPFVSPNMKNRTENDKDRDSDASSQNSDTEHIDVALNGIVDVTKPVTKSEPNTPTETDSGFSERQGVEKPQAVSAAHTTNGNAQAAVDDRIEDEDSSEEDESVPPPPLPRKTYLTNFEEESIHTAEEGGMTMDQLCVHLKTTGIKGIYKEYAMIRAEAPAGTFNCSKATYNQCKNRYTDVLSLDHSRVKLNILDEDDTTDYINANYMDAYKHKNAFIATQGPLPRTFPDFWRMVWEQQVLIIVMTTRVIERGRLKCGQYWPNEEGMLDHYANFRVTNLEIQAGDDYTISRLKLDNLETDESREVAHFQFTSWPDFGVPRSAAAMLDFLTEVRQYQADGCKAMGPAWVGHHRGPPIVVHCSAGIGRTGTFCTLDICLDRLADIGTVNVKETVQRMRTQRAFSIQTPDQYHFCHTAIIEHCQRHGTLGQVDYGQYDDSDSD
ncbi:tyrosine-protein phosphatase non-receptor type 9-like isoform X1 [Branchiostoma floridae]|uniref:Tyrosine-protein phosphatase non-receptor type 9 n=1 Tax=Branchiostoma floridae TaxID=7739 RepID=A0A9J7HTR2_BRAFL|nr:tyrosine-protein phosphatase non-receptor type 9-like isoform X1 [Branchiostoma floridae]